MVSRPPFAAIVVAAGSGTRFGRPKHAILLDSKPIWQWSVEVLERAGAAEVVVVGDVPGGVEGGLRRRDSVLAGLEALTSDAQIVLVHDAARPLVTVGLVHAVVEAVATPGVDGAIPGVPVTDTVKRVVDARIVGTVDRTELVAVQTPQGFDVEALRDAHRRAPYDDATDDAALVEQAGGTVVIVDGERTNMKITFADDLAVAEAILAERAR